VYAAIKKGAIVQQWGLNVGLVGINAGGLQCPEPVTLEQR